MLPSYPSLTFPNHLSLVTGFYPEHHGIVANRFYDPSRNATYVYTKPATNSDGSWHSGTPLWVLAEQQGMRSACLFWPNQSLQKARGTASVVPQDRNIKKGAGPSPRPSLFEAAYTCA